MALNPKTVEFLFNEINKSNYRTFNGITSQLFEYLNNEIKDNPIFDKYQNSISKWSQWPGNEYYSYHSWTIPKVLEDAKELAYNLYRRKAKEEEHQTGLEMQLFSENSYDESIIQFNKTFLRYFGEVLEEIINANPEKDDHAPEPKIGNTVFIVHGHDEKLKLDLQLLLARAGVNNIVLHEQPDKGRTIIDKLMQETNNAGYAIALLTPDDVMDNGSGRARQNVILETGYFLGKIGKERVRMIISEGVEIPSDLQGILYEKLSSNSNWKINLLKEIQAVGIYVDLQAVVDRF